MSLWNAALMMFLPEKRHANNSPYTAASSHPSCVCVRMSVCQHVCLCVGVRESVFCVCVCRGTPLTQPAAQPVAVIGVSIILQSPKWRICTVQRVQC